MTADFSGLNVLVVDDQQHVRKFARDVLAGLGVRRVTEAASGREAVQCVTAPGAADFDLILCDLRMPDIDGIEMIRTLARLGIRSAVAVVSVESERVIESAGLLATLGGLNVVGELSKPLSADKLEPLLRRIVEGAKPRPAVALDLTADDLARALDLHEIDVHYQPKIQMKTGACVGAEAMVRWVHPRHGLLAADAVVPLAERSPVHLEQLTTLTLRDAIAACGRWRADGHEIGVSVNLSPLVFVQLDLPELVERIAHENTVPPSSVTIEVAETTLLDSTLAVAVDVAARLRIKGFRLALDDFTGAKSGVLEILKIPFCELKLDRTSVDGCSEVASRRAVVEAGLAIARSLDLSTVAVGVSRRPDWNLLADLGCDVAQGHFIAHPMPDPGLGIWVTQWLLQQR